MTAEFHIDRLDARHSDCRSGAVAAIYDRNTLANSGPTPSISQTPATAPACMAANTTIGSGIFEYFQTNRNYMPAAQDMGVCSGWLQNDTLSSFHNASLLSSV
mgnify:CR=1 FL=1